MIFIILLVILAYFFCGSMTILLIQCACRYEFIDEYFFGIDLKDNAEVGVAVLLWPAIVICLLFTCIPVMIGMIGKGMIITITAIFYIIKAIFVRDSEEKEGENNE